MTALIGESVVSCYVDAASFLVTVLLLLLSERIYQRKSESLRIYFLLILQVAFICVISFVFHAMYKQPAPWCHTVALISRTLWLLSVLGMITLWLVYVDHKLYGKRKEWTAIRVIRSIPMFVFPVLLIINLFTGIVFTVSEDNTIQRKPLFYVIMTINFLLFLSSAVAVRHFDRKTTKIRFLRVSPMIVSVLIALLPQLFSPYNTDVMGYAIGVTLLYFSMVSETRFMDEESGLYNRGYLAYLFDMALVGKNDSHSALILEAGGNLQAGFEIMHNVLHQTGDVIRVESRKFLMFSNSDSLSTMQYLSSLVDESAEKYNSNHPDSKVQISARCRMRAPEENPFTFLRTVLDDKESGDEMRGIVSMMSELDRLDKELKLAADIQLNMLPMVFPPFPEHHEFDLYASMDPAKEVGGDFYDFFLIDSNHLALVIADVSGKGIPAALFMMVSKTLIKNQLMSGIDPATAVERVNLQLCERNFSKMFVTVWAAVLEISTGKGIACNAGHEKPGVRRAGGDFELLEYKHNMFIGVSKKAKYQNREFELHPGDCVFVYTDGVPEAENVASEMFGEKRLVLTMNRNADAEPEELVRRMSEELNRFAAGAPQFDDITMLCLKYYGTSLTSGNSF